MRHTKTRGAREIVVATYNVHSCTGTDSDYDPDRIARVIGEIAPDVIGLQEVDSGYWKNRTQQTLQRLTDATGMTGIPGPVLFQPDGDYGNALLTRWPATAVRAIDLSVGEREPRGAIDVELDVDGLRVQVVVAHLGLRIGERREQADRLLASLDETGAALQIVLGDFNEWRFPGRLFARLNRKLGYARPVRSFPSRTPLFTLDRIWVRPRSVIESIRAHRSSDSRVASDHLPVVARLHPPEETADRSK